MTGRITHGAKRNRVFHTLFTFFYSLSFILYFSVPSFSLFFFRCGFKILLPFEMFDNIFVGSSAVFPNRSGPVDHKKKRHLKYDGGTQNRRKTEASRERKITWKRASPAFHERWGNEGARVDKRIG